MLRAPEALHRLAAHGHDSAQRPKFDPAVPRWQFGLAITLFLLLVVGTTLYRNYENAFDLAQKIAVLGGIGTLLFMIGNLLDARGLPLLAWIRRRVE